MSIDLPEHEAAAPQRELIAPVPIDLPRVGMGRAAARMLRVSATGSRAFAPAVGRMAVRRKSNAPVAARRMFERLGSTYIKFGQFAAAAPGIVGEDVAAEFRSCLDAGPPVPFDSVRAIVEAETGMRLSDAFADFDETPLAAASIAVVHRATLQDGTHVAVKVLRPGIERTVATDLAIMERVVRFMAARGIDQAYNLVGLIVGLRGQIAEELDLRNEAQTMDTFRAVFEDLALSLLVVPHVHHRLSGRRVLTMDFLDGAPIADIANVERQGADPAPLVRELMRAWILTGLRLRAFHADIHAGNLLLLGDGRLGMLDWGIVARLDEKTATLFRGLCEASIGIESAWADITAGMIEANGPSFYALGLTDEHIANFVRATFEPVLTRPLSEVSMAELFGNGDDVIRKATGTAPSRRSFRDRLRVMRSAARAYRSGAAANTFESPAMRMGFLSSKQLVYLEHYARMYIPDEALLGDHQFIRRALATVEF